MLLKILYLYDGLSSMGYAEKAIKKVFSEAAECSPSIITIDDIDLLCPIRSSSTSDIQKRVVSCLLPLLEGERLSSGIVIVATSSKPNNIDPALRRPGRLDREIELSVPNAEERYAILHVLFNTLKISVVEQSFNESSTGVELLLKETARSAHGMVASDLLSVCKEACYLSSVRSREEITGDSIDIRMANLNLQGLTLMTAADLTRALNRVTPSALREISIEIPYVRWSDIGGMEYVKQSLREVAEWPLLYPQLFSSLGISPPKGVLLYGPPGCSKTLMVYF